MSKDRSSALTPAHRINSLIFHRVGGRVMTLILAGMVTVLVFVAGAKWLDPIEERVGALGWTLFSDGVIEERITLVTIDERSLAEVGPWPWPRQVMSELVEAISLAGAQLQVHDIVYPEPRDGDEEFLGALRRSPGAIIAQVPALGGRPGDQSAGAMTHALAAPSCSSSDLDLASAFSYVAPAPVFSAVPKGQNSALIDSDGSVRKSPTLLCVEGSVYPSLALASFLQLGPSSDWSVEIDTDTSLLQPHALVSLGGYPGLKIPVDETGAMRIDFGSAPESFRAVSASDVLSGNFDAELLENSWVIVGGTAFGMADIVPTPYSGAAYGVELQARMLASILDMQVPYTPVGAPLFQFLLILFFAALIYWTSSPLARMNVYGLPVLSVLLPGLALGAHIYFLAWFDVWIGWVAPALYGLVAAGAAVLLELARARLERGRVYENLSSYLSPLVAREVAFSLPSSSVEARRRDVSLLSADIRNFSAFGESRPPEEIAAILHYFSVRVNEVVESHGGRVAEVKGDSIIAIWDGAGSKEAELALEAAKAMLKSLTEGLFSDHSLKGLEPLALGVGIEQGPVLMGSIGPSSRRSFALLGDTVSTTIRIQEMTSDLAQPILLGSSVAKHLGGKHLQSQGSYLLPGLSIPHTLFAPAPTAEVLRLRGNNRPDSLGIA